MNTVVKMGMSRKAIYPLLRALLTATILQSCNSAFWSFFVINYPKRELAEFDTFQ